MKGEIAQAVQNVARGLALQAGAGTGKTHWMAQRYLALVEGGCSPLEVVAVTFTERAAQELRSRVRGLLREAVREGRVEERRLAELEAAPIGTLHALAARICREFPEEAGVPADFQVMDDLEAPLFLGDWVEEALLKALEDSYTPLLEVVGYEGLRQTLERVAEDPLGARGLLRDLRWREGLRAEAWRGLYRTLESLLGSWPGLAGLWSGVREEDPSTAGPLWDYLKGVNLGQNPWKGLTQQEKEALRKARDLLKEAEKWLSEGEADRKLEKVWPLLERLACTVLKGVEERRFRARRLGYADLEVHALRALRHREVRRHYRERFRHLLVDEFQDTNPVQCRLLRWLFPSYRQWTLVGDPNQSIYGFRRADPWVMGKVVAGMKGHGEAEVLTLDESHRYHGGLARFHNAFFGERLPGYRPVSASRPAPGEGPWVFLYQGTLEEQARMVAGEVWRLLGEGFSVWDREKGAYRPLEPRDVAVLAHRWKDLAQVAEVLQEEGLPAVEARGGNLLETQEFQDAYLALRFLADPKDEEALIGLLRAPFFALTDGELRRLAEARGAEGTTLWEALQKHPELSPEARRAREVLADLKGRRLEPPSQLLQRLDAATGYTGVVSRLPRGPRRVKDWEATLELVRHLEMGGEEAFLVVRRLRRLLQEEVLVERPPLDVGNALTLITAHSAKGLEWPVVFVVQVGGWNGRSSRKDQLLFRPGCFLVPPVLDGEGNASALFELAKSALKKEEREEKERLLYVACTRAVERLYLFLWKDTRERGTGDQHLEDLKAALERAGACSLDPPPVPGGTPDFPVGSPEVRTFLEPLERIPLGSLPVSLLALARRNLEAARRRLLGQALEDPSLEEALPLEEVEEDSGPGGELVGTMTHALLERYEEAPLLEKEGGAFLEASFPEAAPEERQEALGLARTFLTREAFAPFRGTGVAKEVPVAYEVAGVRLEGRADRVGEGWVLDYKTDRQVDLEAYRLQVGVYALALGKPRAYVADLREGRCYDVPLEGVEALVEELLRQLQYGEMHVLKGQGPVEPGLE